MLGRGRSGRWPVIAAIASFAGACAFAAPADAAPGTLRIEGTPGDDHIVIDASAVDAGSYTVNGQTQPFAGVTKVIVDAGAGNDSVVVNNPTAGLFAPLLGMAVDGGDGADSVTSQNGVAATGSYASAFGSTPGRLVQVGPAKQVITTVAVENASDFNSDQKFVYKGTPGHDDLWVDDYPSYPLTSLRTIYTRPTNFSFGGKSAVTVDTLGTDSAPDTVKLTGRGQPFSDLAVDDGSQPAEDVITAQDFRFGEAGSGANLRLHGSRIEATPGTSGVDITAGTVALDGGTIGTSGAPLVTDTAGLDALAQGDLRILVKGRFMTSDVQLGGVRKPIGGGVRSTDGSVWLAHEWNGAFTSLAQDAVVSGQSVYLRSDRLDISKGHVNAGAGGVTFQSNNPVPIDLGATTDDYGSFNLSAAEIANVRGPVLSIGQPTSGLVTASDAITRPSTTSLGLISGTGFTA